MPPMSRLSARIAILLLAALITAGCSSQAPAGSPTPNPEDVIRTAVAIAELTKQAVTPTPTRAPFTPTPEAPTSTPSPAPSPTADFPVAIALYNAYVRSGPDEAYPSIDFILQNQAGEIVGRHDNLNPGNSAGTWWLLRRIGDGLDGWVFGGAVEVRGNTNFVPPVEPPPL